MPSKMPSRRQQKICRIIREAVSDIICNQLSDPRIEGLITVTSVDVSPDNKNADVFLSILASDEKVAHKTFTAITHATGHIQTEVGRRMTTRFFPKLSFKEDVKLKKTLETMRLIDEATRELEEKDARRREQNDTDIENGEE